MKRTILLVMVEVAWRRQATRGCPLWLWMSSDIYWRMSTRLIHGVMINLIFDESAVVVEGLVMLRLATNPIGPSLVLTGVPASQKKDNKQQHADHSAPQD